MPPGLLTRVSLACVIFPCCAVPSGQNQASVLWAPSWLKDGKRRFPSVDVGRVQRSGDGLQLREASLDDLEVLVMIEREAVSVAYAHVFPADEYPCPVQQVREEWMALLTSTSTRTVVAEDGSSAVGTVTVEPPELQRLFVLPDRQRQGVGHLLHDWACAALSEAGTGTARLRVLEANDRARCFYEQHGWQQEGPVSVSHFPPYPSILSYRLSGLQRGSTG